MDQWLAQLLMVIESVGFICATALIAYRMQDVRWHLKHHDK